MSQENVDLFLEAANRLTADDLDGFSKLLHPDVTTSGVDGWPEPGPFVGLEAVVGEFERIVAEFEEQRFTDIEVVAERDDWTVFAYRWQVRGSRSGIETHLDLAVACRVKGAQLIEVHVRLTRDEALEAAGLRA